MPSHTVKQGECLSNIAKRYGFGVDAVWGHENNKALRDKRKSPNVLHVGDVLFIPEIGQKQMKVAPNATHQFQVKGKAPELRIVLLAGGKPVKDASFTLAIDGVDHEPKKAKKTDGAGTVKAPIDSHAKAAVLTVPKQNTVYEVSLGHLDPISEVSGVKQRLRQLGYYTGPIDDESDEAFQIGLWLFQNNKGLVPTGTIDDATLDEVTNAYGM